MHCPENPESKQLLGNHWVHVCRFMQQLQELDQQLSAASSSAFSTRDEAPSLRAVGCNRFRQAMKDYQVLYLCGLKCGVLLWVRRERRHRRNMSRNMSLLSCHAAQAANKLVSQIVEQSQAEEEEGYDEYYSDEYMLEDQEALK